MKKTLVNFISFGMLFWGLSLSAMAQSDQTELLSEQFQVSSDKIEEMRSENGWGETFNQLAIADHLSQTDTITYPTINEALVKVETLRNVEGMGYGQIAKTLGFKLGPVISQARHERNELRKANGIVEADTEAEDAELEAVQEELEQNDVAQSKSSKVNELSGQFQVPPEKIEEMRSKTGWGGISNQLAIAEHLSKVDPITYPTINEALTKVETLRAEGLGYGEIAKTLGFKLGPVISESRHVRNELRKGNRETVEGAQETTQEAKEVTKEAKQTAKEAKQTAKETAKEVKQTAKEISKEAKASAKEAKKTAKENAKEAKQLAKKNK